MGVETTVPIFGFLVGYETSFGTLSVAFAGTKTSFQKYVSACIRECF